MGKLPRQRPQFRRQLFIEDMAERGWLASDLARAARVSEKTVSSFLRGRFQNPQTAKRFADALGKPLRRYLIREASAA